MTEQTALTIGLVGKWLIGLLVVVVMGVGGYWINQYDARSNSVSINLESLRNSVAVMSTQLAVTKASLDDMNYRMTQLESKIYTATDAIRDRERQTEIDKAQNQILQDLRADVKEAQRAIR